MDPYVAGTQAVGTTDAAPDALAKPDQELAGYRYAKALCEIARGAFGERVRSFKKNWDFMLGKDNWKTPLSLAARQLDEWSFRGVVQWTFATIKTKASMLCSIPTEIFCEPLDDGSSYYDRLLAKSAIEHELARLRFNQVKEDAYLWGSVSGVGISMVTYKPDPLTGTMALSLVPIRSDQFFRDPSADSITSPNCRFVVWEPVLDMSTIREMWPGKADKVKPTGNYVSGGWNYRTETSLLYGAAGEFSIGSDSTLNSRKAVVSFVWVRDESIIEDLQQVILKDAGPGYQCVSCDAMYEQGAANPNQPCPTCGGDMEDVTIPAKTQENKIIRRQYPYGRLLVYSGKTLLFDGENPCELETVFPFAVYHHDRIPGDFYGTNDVDLLRSLQEAENTVLSMGVDGVVMSMFGPFEYPVGCKSYTDLGNGPKERHPVPDHLSGKARFVPSSGADMNLWHGVLQKIEQQFTIVSGLSGPSLGQTSSPPISATEAEITNARLSDRMKGHAQAFSAYCSDVASIVWALMQQFYEAPMTVPVRMPDSELKSIAVEVQSLPKMRIRVEINTQEAIKDKLLGQNLAGFVAQGGMDSPHADIVLEAFGVPATRIKELLARRGLQQEIAPGVPAGPPVAPPQPQMQGGM